MIIVKFSGGLGNQIYQYALLRLLRRRYPNTEIKADLSDYVQYDQHYGFELDKIFHLDEKGLLEKASFGEQVCVRGEMPLVMRGRPGKLIEPLIAWLNCRMRNVYAGCGHLHVINEQLNQKYMTGKDVEQKAKLLLEQIESMDVKKHWYLNGFWQQEMFFLDGLDGLREELIFPPYERAEDMDLAARMCNEDSVSVHVRCGDYLNSPYQILDQNYYREARKLIEAQIANPVYYVFSDDIDRAQKLLSWLPSDCFMKTHTGYESWRDLQLMRECKYHIIANSSFSTWAAYLDNRKNKMVIYPSMQTAMEETGLRSETGWYRVELGHTEKSS